MADRNHIGGLDLTDVPPSIKRQAMDRNFQPSVRIGKTGITENIIQEIRAQLVKRKLVKIKIIQRKALVMHKSLICNFNWYPFIELGIIGTNNI